MSDEEHGRFVRCHIEGEWHVMFVSPQKPTVFVSVARFQNEKRAESYCDVENDCYRDDPKFHHFDDLEPEAAPEPPPARSLAEIGETALKRMAETPERYRLPPGGVSEHRNEIKQRMLSEIEAAGTEGHGGTGPLLTKIRVGYNDLCVMLRELVEDGLVAKIGRARGVRYFAKGFAPANGVVGPQPKKVRDPVNFRAQLTEIATATLEKIEACADRGVGWDELREAADCSDGQIADALTALNTRGLIRRQGIPGDKDALYFPKEQS